MKYCFWILSLILISCGSSNHLKKFYTIEDKTAFDLVDQLQKNPSNQSALKELPVVYKALSDKRRNLSVDSFAYLAAPERYLQLAKEWGIMQQLYDKIYPITTARQAVPDLWNPANAIQEAKVNAAKLYYNQGLDKMTYREKSAAREAYQLFRKANDLVPGYEDVKEKMTAALDKATLKVIIKAADYYNHSYNYWGFQGDWLQQQMVNDLNRQSYADTRFYAEWEAINKNILPDRIVELGFNELFVGQLFTNRYTISRSKEVDKVTTATTVPNAPEKETVYATVYVTSRVMQSRASLQCRIYDPTSNRNVLYDQFPGYNDWKEETATYRGDSRALTADDQAKINNRGTGYTPTRNEVADKLVRSCYTLLITRIRNGVQFGN